MTESELAGARSETVEGIGGCLVRMSKAVHLLTLAQRRGANRGGVSCGPTIRTQPVPPSIARLSVADSRKRA